MNVLFNQHPAGRLAEYLDSPVTLGDAAALLRQHPDAQVISGGTYLTLMASQGQILPRRLVSLRQIAGLSDVRVGFVGARATLRQLAGASPAAVPAVLRMAAGLAAGPLVRSAATVGGNVAMVDGDLVPAMMVLAAEVHLHDAASCPIDTYLTTRPRGVVTGFSYDADGWSSASARVSIRAMDWPLAVAAVAVRHDGPQIVGARAALTGFGAQPSLCPATTAVLNDSEGEPEALEYAAQACTERLAAREDPLVPKQVREAAAVAAMRHALALAVAADPSRLTASAGRR